MSHRADTIAHMDRAYISFETGSDRDQAVLAAVQWCLQHASPQHHRAVLWLPDTSALDDLPKTRRLVHGGLTMRSDRPGRRGHPALPPDTGPVIAFCHSMDRLAELEPARHPLALVGAHSETIDPRFGHFGLAYHQPWIDAFNPEHLGGPMIPPRRPLQSSPVAAAAMDTFTALTYGGKTMHRSDDGGRVTHGLMLLHQAGYALDPDELFAAALQRAWLGSEAITLRTTATQIVRGERKRPSARLSTTVLEQWSNTATVGSTKRP